MKKTIFTYGLIAGIIIAVSMLIGWSSLGSAAADGETGGETGGVSIELSEWLGYLVMLIALSVIFLGIKRYRDRNLGGVIKFGTAFLLGLGISVMASLIYVVSWEVSLAVTDYAFIENYTQAMIANKKAEGLAGAELDTVIADMERTKERYAKPLYRLSITFLEMFPVGLLVTLLSAAILRKREILPATG